VQHTVWRWGLSVGIAFLLAGCAALGIRSSDVSDAPSRACFPVASLDSTDRALADTLVRNALNHEALYTVAGGLKPVSTVIHERLPLARPDSVPHGTYDVVTADAERAALDRAGQLNRVAEALTCGALTAVVVPFASTQNQERAMQVLFVHEQRLKASLSEHAAFWGQWGFTPGADPGVVITTIEHAARNDRHRGYGVLFGYPKHAVSFFVEADRRAQANGDFVERDFFHIPTHKAETNRFTYAIPDGYAPARVDSSLYHSATAILREYRSRRPNYRSADGTLQGIELLRDWFREDPTVDPRRNN